MSKEEIDCLSWFVETVLIKDCTQAIMEYCNEQYEMIDEEPIKENMLECEIDILAIAVNIDEIAQSKDGLVYPEVSFLRDCGCAPEHGICIGFRNQKFFGIHAQDRTL